MYLYKIIELINRKIKIEKILKCNKFDIDNV